MTTHNGVAHDVPARWGQLKDELLRGVAHALSNRIATVSASAYMLEFGDMTTEQGVASLQRESERLNQLLQHLRLLPVPPDAETEPVLVTDILADAIALHAHHGVWHRVNVDIVFDGDVLPVLVMPHALLHASLCVLTAAKRTAAAERGRVRIRLHSSADEVTMVTETAPDDVMPFEEDVDLAGAGAGDDAEAAQRLLADALGTVTALDSGHCVLRLPSLAAARRAERALRA